ncbi:GntR family transcriptional regulator [Paraburkholderia caffeinilytica]|uniref:GntR family transcriptional regulator n=1 Tax=Paraburkholderia caffeinilytica TaxID=1761016 RepID=UPI0038B796CE
MPERKSAKPAQPVRRAAPDHQASPPLSKARAARSGKTPVAETQQESRPVAQPGPRNGNSSQHAYDRLRQMIIESELTPGSYLLEQDLALMFGVSRTPIREAAIRLQGEGLVEIVPRHGIRIVPTSVSDISYIYQVLISLESTAAALVAARSDVDLSPLEKACQQMTDALDAQDMHAWAAADEAFHEALVHLGGNARLAQVVMNCRDQVHRVRRFTQQLRPHPQPKKSIAEHYEIIEAMRRGDAARATRLYRAHRERGWREQTAVLQQYGIHQA